MEEMPHPPSTPARPSRGRRFAFGLAGVAVLLVLAAAGLVLATRTALRDRPITGAEDEVARVVRDYRGAVPAGSLEEVLAHPDVIPTHDHPLLGRQAPDFQLADPDGRVWDLAELRADGPVVLIFYYGYYCGHCVQQLFDVNRDLPLFRELGARVVAVSADPPELTRRRYQHYGPFGFPVLSDPGNETAHAYHVFRGDLLCHGTFVIDRDGVIRWVNVGDAPFRRNSALLYQLARIEGRLPRAQPEP